MICYHARLPERKTKYVRHWYFSKYFAMVTFDLIRHRAFRLVGRVWSTWQVFWFSDAWGLVFLSLNGATWYYLRYLRSSFHAFFALVFRPPFQRETILKKLITRNLHSQNNENRQINHHRNAPTAKSCKKASFGRGQNSEINNLYNTFNCFPKGPDLSKWSRKETQNGSFGH